MNAIIPAQSFQEKLEERIKKDIGDLIPNDALAEMVTRALDKAFFEERVIKGRNTWDNQTTIPWIIKLVKKEMDEKVEVHIRKWIGENDAALKAQVKEQMDKGLATAVVNAFDNIFRQNMLDMEMRIQQTIENMRLSQ